MTDPSASTELISIGEFSRLCGLTPKALRLYDGLDILRPVKTDPTNGYRYYATTQIESARIIVMLRALDMSLDDIGSLLADLAVDRPRATQRISDHVERLEAEHSARRLLAGHVQALLRKETPPMFAIETRQVDAQRVMSIQRRLHADQTDAFLAEAKREFATVLDGREPVGPFTVIFHGIVDHESDGPIEAILGCGDDVEPSGSIGVRTEPAHDVAFTTITKSQWDFPAILAAYDAVACSPEALARPDATLSCREVYLAEPDAIGPNDQICDVAFPLGPKAV